MVYTELTNRALSLAYQAHQGQVDKSGVPYIFHPAHLAEQMEDEISCCAALLHDVVEDTSVTLADLEAAFPPEVTEAVRLLTHREGTPYEDYVRAIAQNPVARRVKLADIAHNSDQSRMAGSSVSQEKRLYLQHKGHNRVATVSGCERIVIGALCGEDRVAELIEVAFTNGLHDRLFQMSDRKHRYFDAYYRRTVRTAYCVAIDTRFVDRLTTPHKRQIVGANGNGVVIQTGHRQA